jgi:hypothetical protein
METTKKDFNPLLSVKLIHCNSINIANPNDDIEKNIFYLPMGVFALAALLEKEGIAVEILHMDLEAGTPPREILALETLDAVGLDCHWANQTLVVLETARLIKQLKPGVFIFLGGYTASFFTREILSAYPAIDAIVKGDGEIPLLELCRALAHGRQNKSQPALKGVQNLVWRSSDGEIVTNPHTYTARTENLEPLDFAAVDLLKNWQNYRDLCKFWTRFSPLNQFPLFFLEIGRGCRYNCSFCGGSSRAQHCISNRQQEAVRSLPAIIATIKKAMSFGYTMFYATLEFENSEAWYCRLFQRIRQEGLKINLGYGSWGLPSKQFIDEMSTTFAHVLIEISPETSNLELRKKNKDPRLFYDNRRLEEILDHAGTKPNVKIQLYFGYFLPFDTPDTIFATIGYITALFFKYSQFTELFYTNFSTDPAALFYLQPEKYRMEMAAGGFQDFITQLQEYCLVRREMPAGGMTLARPASISAAEALQLTGKILLFNSLLENFAPGILQLLQRTGDMEILADYLRDLDPAMIPTGQPTVENVKILLLDLCNQHHITIPDLGRPVPLQPRANPGADETRPITKRGREEIDSVIQKAKETIQLEFNF